jgi:hypothetical protein
VNTKYDIVAKRAAEICRAFEANGTINLFHLIDGNNDSINESLVFHAKKEMDMAQEIIKIKIIDTVDNKTTIVELTDLQSLPENIKKIIQTVFPASLLIFVGKINSKLSVETLYKIAQTVHKIV